MLGAGGASIVEDFDRGSDTITSTVSRSLELEANIENLTLLAGIIGTGNTFANIIVGNAGANTLDGLTDRDDLRGGDGSDTYFADVANEIIKETNTSIATGGNDLVRYSGATGTFVLADNVERLTLTHVTASTNGTGNGLGNTIIGNGGANILNGLDGADSLNGGAGRDDLRGGNGSDTYFADVANEIIRETNTSLATGGNDLVNFSGATGTFTLSANVERLTLTHATANTGGIGNGLVNTIIGNAGKNILDGKALKDILRGFNGSDTYIVDASRDTVIEASGNAAGRADLVKFTGTAAQTYALTVNVENLTLMGSCHHPRHGQRSRQHHHRQQRGKRPQRWFRQRHARRHGWPRCAEGRDGPRRLRLQIRAERRQFRPDPRLPRRRRHHQAREHDLSSDRGLGRPNRVRQEHHRQCRRWQ